MHRHTHSHVHHGLPFSVSPCTQRTCLSSCLSTPWSRPSFSVFEPHTVRPGRLKVSVRLSLCSSWSLIPQCLQSSNGIWNGWEPCRAHVQWQFEAINVIVSGVKKSNMAFPVVCVCVCWGRGLVKGFEAGESVAVTAPRNTLTHTCTKGVESLDLALSSTERHYNLFFIPSFSTVPQIYYLPLFLPVSPTQSESPSSVSFFILLSLSSSPHFPLLTPRSLIFYVIYRPFSAFYFYMWLMLPDRHGGCR